MTMRMAVKAYLQTPDGGMEVRRVPLSVSTTCGMSSETAVMFAKMYNQLGTAFPGLKGRSFTIMWRDSDGDMILMSSDEELQDALTETVNEVLKLYLTPGEENSNFDSDPPSEMVEDSEPTICVEAESQSQGDAEKTGNHDQPDPFVVVDDDDDETWGMYGVPQPPQPPHCHGGRGRRRCGRGGRYSPMFGFGPGHRGGHFGPMMSGFIPPPPPPPPVPPFYMGYGGKHGGGMWCPPPPPPPPVPPFCPFPGTQGQDVPPFHRPMKRRGHGCHGNPWMHGGHHWGRMGHFHAGQGHGPHHGHFGSGCDGKKAWKRAMKESIPKAHRRWAKFYIRNWRMENVKDATTTSSDTDGDKKKQPLDREACGVPEVYQLWLEVMLPRWHANWGGRKADIDTESSGEKTKNNYKDSVPFEFRKWVRGFLHKHFGQRQSPKLCRKNKGEGSGKDGKDSCGDHHHHGHCHKAAAKKHALKASVPVKQRVWAKRFILAWRLENKIPTDEASFSDSDMSDVEVTAPEAGVPDEYVQWLRVFLPRWHMWRGQCSRDKVQQVPMNQFKDSVPMEFRRFVKFHLGKRYGKMAHSEDSQSYSWPQYQLWLQAFKKQWLAEHSKDSDSDVICVTSSDDDAFNTEQEMESGLKKLRLSEGANTADGNKKTVTFNPQAFDTDSEDEDFTDVPHGYGKALNPEFRAFAKKALYSWDGQPSVQTEAAQRSEGDGQDMPPFIYRWMARKMMKMQLKKAKRERKIMKHEMKAAMKQAKRNQRY